MGLATFALALLSIIGYLYDSDPLYSVAQLTVIALQTATFILAVSIALVAAVPEHLPMRWLLAEVQKSMDFGGGRMMAEWSKAPGVTVESKEALGAVADHAKIEELFPKTYGRPRVVLQPTEAK